MDIVPHGRQSDRRPDVNRYRRNWQDEVDSASEYRAVAELEPDDKLRKVFESLARVEEAHVIFWEDRLRRAGAEVGERRPSVRSRILMWIARRLGPKMVISTIAAREAANQNVYVSQPETTGTRMSSQERWHARVLQQLVASHPRQGLEGGFLGRLEGRHRAAGGNALRAAVLGANDGLCSNLSLVMGMAGAAVNPHGLIVTGLAGLLAGAFSMALGEWVSVTSARELAQREIEIESDELEFNPQAEGDELQLIYQSKGLSEGDARNLANHLLTDKDAALDALSREELGIDPQDLGGSALEAALVSFFLFSLGAIVPVIPLLVLNGSSAIWGSIVLSGLGLFGIGAAITLFTGRPILLSGSRQLLLGLLAAGTTFLVGRVIGVSMGG